MSKISYKDKINVLDVINRPTQATAEDFNEIKNSVNKIYDLLGAGGIIDLFEDDPIDGSWRIVGDYDSDIIKFERWSEASASFIIVYQAGQSIESDAFILNSISGQIKFKDVAGKNKALIRPSVTSKDAVVIGNGSGLVALFGSGPSVSLDMLEDEVLKTSTDLTGGSSETTIIVPAEEIFEWGLEVSAVNMYVKSVIFDVISPTTKFRYWVEDEKGNVMFETCSVRDYEKGSENSDPLTVGVNTIKIPNPTTVLAGTLTNPKIIVSEAVTFQAARDTMRLNKVPKVSLNINRFETTKMMTIKKPSVMQLEGSSEYHSSHGVVAHKPLCGCEETLFNIPVSQKFGFDNAFTDPMYEKEDGMAKYVINHDEIKVRTFSDGIHRFEFERGFDKTDPDGQVNGIFKSINIKFHQLGMYSIRVYVKNHYDQTTYNEKNLILNSDIFRLESMNGPVEDFKYGVMNVVNGIVSMPITPLYKRLLPLKYYVELTRHDRKPMICTGQVGQKLENGGENFLPYCDIDYLRLKRYEIKGAETHIQAAIYKIGDTVMYNGGKYVCIKDNSIANNPSTATDRWISADFTVNEIQKIKGAASLMEVVKEGTISHESNPKQLAVSVDYAVDSSLYTGTTYFRSPQNPVIGSKFSVWDINGKFSENPVAIIFDRYKGQDDFGVICNIDYKTFEFIYLGFDYGWYIKGTPI